MDIKNNSYLLIETDTNNGKVISITIHENKKSAEYLSFVDSMSNFDIIKVTDILEYSDYQKIIFN